MTEVPKVRVLFNEIVECPVEESSRKSIVTARETTGSATINDIDLIWEKIEELTLTIKNQDHAMTQVIERCQNIDLSYKKCSEFIDDGFPRELSALEKKIDDRCTFFMDKTSQSGSEEMKNFVERFKCQLDSLNSTIKETQNKLAQLTPSPSPEIDVDSLISNKINEIDFVPKIQAELTETKFVETDDPKLVSMENLQVETRVCVERTKTCKPGP